MSNLNLDMSKVTPHEGYRDILSEGRDTSRTWSLYQEAIFDFVEQGEGNAIVEAVAGSGKSTTIIEAMKLVSGSTIFLAFNKAIAEELKSKGVNARTFHSLCFGPVMRAKKANNPEIDKLKKLCRENMSEYDYRLYSAFCIRVVGLARQQGVGFLTADHIDTYQAICNHHDIEPESEEADFGQALEYAQELLTWSNESPDVDFDDMLYYAVRDNISLPKFDFVFVDEAQDTNMIQREILKKIIRPGGRMIAVGDPAQSIYGFRGADSNSLAAIAKEFNAVTLPLSISYRCPVNVVNYAKQWVSHIEAAENAPEGIVEHLEHNWEPSIFQPNDLVICRKTAPLLTLAFRCIRNNIPVQVLGREIGQGLKTLIKKMKPRDLDDLEEKLNIYLQRELAKARKQDDEAKAEAVSDRVTCLLYLAEGLQEEKRTLEWLDKGIDYLFKDKVNCLKLCTIHKSKGLEADRVFWLNRNECPAQWARRPWQQQEERNLCYVASTRAKKALYMIEDGSSRNED